MQMPNTTAEQQARDMLERMGVPNAQCYAASDLVELANLISDRTRAALAADPQGQTFYAQTEEHALKRIALIAHGGGLIGYEDQWKAMCEIRRLTQPWVGDQINELQRQEAQP